MAETYDGELSLVSGSSQASHTHQTQLPLHHIAH